MSIFATPLHRRQKPAPHCRGRLYTLAWDRREARFFYTHKNGTVYRYDVEAGQAEALKTFKNPSVAGPSGLSLNELGDRLLLRMTDKSVRTYRLPALDDERICAVEIPDGWFVNWDKLRFTGHKDYFALTFEQQQPLPGGRAMPLITRIYDGVHWQIVSQAGRDHRRASRFFVGRQAGVRGRLL